MLTKNVGCGSAPIGNLLDQLTIFANSEWIPMTLDNNDVMFVDVSNTFAGICMVLCC